MSDVKWIKITTDIFDDEKILLIESLPESDAIIVIWFKLLCLAGKMNNSGVFLMNNRIPITVPMLATIFRRKEATVKLALDTFCQFGMVDIVEDVITIPNWGKHQTMDQLESKKEYMREYMKEYRKKQHDKIMLPEGVEESSKSNSKTNNKTNVSSLDKDINIDIDIDKEDKYNTHQKTNGNNGVAVDFDVFWKAYPRKVGKAEARKAFQKLDKDVSIDTLLRAIEVQKNTQQWKKDNGQFIPHPATWLNNRRWEDEVGPVGQSPKRSNNPFLEMLRKEEGQYEQEADLADAGDPTGGIPLSLQGHEQR